MAGIYRRVQRGAKNLFVDILPQLYTFYAPDYRDDVSYIKLLF